MVATVLACTDEDGEFACTYIGSPVIKTFQQFISSIQGFQTSISFSVQW